MRSLSFTSDCVTIGVGETVIVCSFLTGNMSSLLLRAEKCDVKIMAPGSGDGLTLKEGEPFTLTAAQDFSIVPSGQVVELRARNLDPADDAKVSVLVIGVRDGV